MHFPLLRIKSLFLLGISLGIFLSSCNPDDETIDPDPDPMYTIPATYNFENVSYSGQTTRLAMLSELKSYMGTSKTSGVSLSEDRLLGMYANDVDAAQWENTYDDSKQLKSKTLENVQSDFEALFVELANASQSIVTGEPGISGVIESNNGEKKYLIGDDGLDHAQVIEKGLMGACLYYQSTSVYFGDERMNVDNVTVTDGKGTEMEHHWDEAFGYLGVPIDFPTNLDGLAFWGSYSDRRNAVINCNQLIMDAMLKGRAAISNDDLSTRDEAISEAREIWELIAVGSALHYINSGIENFDDKALALHGLSEGIGFIYALKFNEAKKISNTQIDALLTTFAGSADFSNMNLYNTTIDDLQMVKDELADYYNLADKKDQF